MHGLILRYMLEDGKLSMVLCARKNGNAYQESSLSRRTKRTEDRDEDHEDTRIELLTSLCV